MHRPIVIWLLSFYLHQQVESRLIHGSIKTLDSWLYVDRFAFKAPTSTTNRRYGVDGREIFESQGRIEIMAVFPSNVRLSIHVYFDEVQNQVGERKTEDFMSSKSWNEVYTSGNDCQWLDLQSRRHGNTIDIFKEYSHTSKTGYGTPMTDGWVPRALPANQTNPLPDSNWTTNNETRRSRLLEDEPTGDEREFRFSTFSQPVLTSKARYFYVAISNCLPGKKISTIEAETGKSNDQSYAVSNKELVCASKSTFCQGSLAGIKFWLRMHQSASDGSNTRESFDDFSAEETSQYICALVLLILDTFLVLYVMYLNYLHQSCCLLNVGSSKSTKTISCCHSANRTTAAATSPTKGRVMLLLLTTTLFFHYLSIILTFVYYNFINRGVIQLVQFNDVSSSSFGRTPVYPETVRVTGEFMFFIAHSIFVLVIVLIAKGKGIVKIKLSAKSKMKIAIYMTLYICLQINVFIWKNFMYDPALVLLEYESTPGVVLICARCLVFWWFAWSCFTTLKKKQKKMSFYRQFCCVYSSWLGLLPLLICVCLSLNMDVLYREQCYYIVEQVSTFIGILIVAMFWNGNIVSKLFASTSTLSSQNQDKNFFGVNRTAAMRVNGTLGNPVNTGMEQRERQNILDSAIIKAVSLQYKLQRMQDDSEDLSTLITELTHQRSGSEIEMATYHR